MSRQRGGERVRKGFIVLQFTISMALIICSAVIGKQLYFIRHADTGVNRENIVMFPFGATMEHYGAYQREVAALPAVRKAGTAFLKCIPAPCWSIWLVFPEKPQGSRWRA